MRWLRAFVAGLLTLVAIRSAKPAHAQAQPPYVAPTEIVVRMFKLTASGASTGVECAPGDTAFGCGSGGNVPYPYATNPITISMQNDYLLDVVPQEMGLFYHPNALRAQAVAARTYAFNNILNGRNINNSISFQAFIPGKFESLGPQPANADSACASLNLSRNQQLVCEVVLPVRYLTVIEDLPMFAEFAADWTLRTKAGSRAGLVAVDDPISSACDANDFGHGRGMSQEGASRWARGDQCSYSASGRAATPWRVRWPAYEQILYHYYTQARLRTGDGTPLHPDLRWNPLAIDATSQLLFAGRAHAVGVTVQNTGVTSYLCGGEVLSYTLVYQWVGRNAMRLDGSGQGRVPCGLTPGNPSPVITLTLADVPNWSPGAYTMTLDLQMQTVTSGSVRLSNLGWPAFDVPIQIITPITPAVFLPLVNGR
jgi:hypothetical protein